MKRLFSFFLFLLFVTGCSSEHSLSSSPGYGKRIGELFSLTGDSYIYRLHDNKNELFLGRKITPKVGLFILPDEVDRSYIGRRIKSIVILDVLEEGTVFEIVDFLETRTFENRYTNALVKVGSGESAREYRLAYVMEREVKPPEISPLFATRVEE